MSSRRKSSTPCMVRVVHEPPKPLSDLEELMDVDMPSDVPVDNGAVMERGPSEPSNPTSEKHQDPQEHPENPEKTEQETFSRENQSPPKEPSERNELSNEEEEDAVVEDDGSVESKEGEGADYEAATPRRQHGRKYECKYCPFSTQNLDNFKEHVDSSHPNVILNPLYLCAVCNFSTKKFDSLTEHNESQHPGETNFKFKRVKMNNQTILEQTIEGVDNSVECDLTNGQCESNGGGTTAFPHCISTTVTSPDSIQSIYQGNGLKSHLDNLLQKDQITAVNINGTVIIPEPMLFQGLSHVTPHLQRPPNFNCVPKIAVPLNTTKYNPSLDSNLTLITSFSKFPYPTHAELSWLTAASKHPEEQIKVWFTTQRLKQGITWSPEEVEEARKKMFNGSIPPAHHTFTAAPASPAASQPSSSSAKASQQPVVHTTVEHPNHVKMSSMSNGLNSVTVTTTSVPSHGLKRPLPTHATSAMFAPESKRPIMAVAPHSGDPKDKGLMAPPPPPPPLKDRLPMAPPPVPAETKRPAALPAVPAELKRLSAAVPLMPPPSSKGKLLAAAAPLLSSFNSKNRPVVSLPSILFQHSLNRPFLAPPPIIAPPFKNYLIPHPSSNTSKDKNPITHALLAPDMKLPNSPPLVAPQIRRPPIIQSVRAPLRATSSQIPTGFPSPKLKEQQQQGGGELKGSRGDKMPTEANGVSHAEARWSHEQNPHIHNNGFAQLYASKSLSVPTQFPLLERMKGKTAEQLKILEENFLRKSFPTHVDVDNLALATRLSRQEIESWFEERRALRDNLEQALLNSMGTKRMVGFGMGNGGGAATAALLEKRLQHQHQLHQAMQLNGVHKPSSGHVRSPPPILPIVAPLAPPPTVPSSVPSAPTSPCSVPADRRSPALLKDVSAQARWPSSPEELTRAFGDARAAGLKGSGAPEWTELFHKMNNSAAYGIAAGGGGGVNGSGQQGASVSSSESVSSIIQRCHEAGAGKMSEGDLGRLAAELRPKSLSIQQHQDLHDWLSGRLRPQSAAELKNGLQSGGVGGGPREVFGSWLDDGGGHLRRVRELALEREKKMVEDASGRLTG